MNTRNLFVALIAMYLVFTPAFAEENDISTLNQRVTRLEEQKKNLEEQKAVIEGQKTILEEQKKVLEVQKDNLKEQKDFLEKSYNTKIGTLDERLELGLKNNYLSWTERFLMIILGGGFGSFFGYFLIKKQIKEIAEETSEKEFENFFKNEEKRKKIEALIEERDEELQLKKTKSIVVLSKNEDDKKYLKKFFETMGFEDKNISYKPFDLTQDYNGIDLILLNNVSKIFDDNDKAEIIKYGKAIREKKVILLYFSKSGFSSDQLKEFGDNFTSATINSQLYGNLMNALRYHEMLLK